MSNARVTNLTHELKPAAGWTHKSVAATGTATALTTLLGTLPAGAKSVELQVAGGTVRSTSDGATNPTTTLGRLWTDGAVKVVSAAEYAALRVILASGTPKIEAQAYTV